MIDAKVKEHTIEKHLGASSNLVLDTCMSSQPHDFYDKKMTFFYK
jgi:hypothetical protein